MLFFIFITRTFEENKQKQTKENNNNNNVQKKQQPINKKKIVTKNKSQRTKFYHELINNCKYKQIDHPTKYDWGGGSYLLTCHNWSTGNVVVKKLSKVGQIWREAGADLDLIVTVVDHITDPPGAGEGVAVYTFNPRHFDT